VESLAVASKGQWKEETMRRGSNGKRKQLIEEAID
jgi:hypothetical protein